MKGVLLLLDPVLDIYSAAIIDLHYFRASAVPRARRFSAIISFD
jgi:hypothetical protein